MPQKTLYNRPLNLYDLEMTAEWLDADWSVFCTFTYHRKMTLKSARRKMVALQEHLANLYGTETRMFWVTEPFQDTASCHVHALIKIPEPSQALETTIRGAWHKVAPPAGYKKHSLTTVARYEPGRGANYYVAKYLQSDKVDYDVF